MKILYLILLFLLLLESLAYEDNLMHVRNPDNQSPTSGHRVLSPKDSVRAELNLQDINPLSGVNDYNYQAALSTELARIRGSLDKSIKGEGKATSEGPLQEAESALEESEDEHEIAEIGKDIKDEDPSIQDEDLKPNTCIPDENVFVGTNLFGGYRKRCFSVEDVALLTARRDFEMLVPKNIDNGIVNDKKVGMLIKYFCNANKVVQLSTNEDTKRLAQKALYDTLGGYLRSYLLPLVKLSYYAGEVNQKTVENVMELYSQSKVYLNTNGNGWRKPKKDLHRLLLPGAIRPLQTSELMGDDASVCACLDLNEDGNGDSMTSNMIVPLPRVELDEDGLLDSVILPLKKKKIFNLRSPASAYVISNFYEAVLKCYNFQNLPHDVYDKKFREWLNENLYIHMCDEEFYPGLGGVLRILETLDRDKKSIKVPFKHEDRQRDDEITVYRKDRVADLTQSPPYRGANKGRFLKPNSYSDHVSSDDVSQSMDEVINANNEKKRKPFLKLPNSFDNNDNLNNEQAGVFQVQYTTPRMQNLNSGGGGGPLFSFENVAAEKSLIVGIAASGTIFLIGAGLFFAFCRTGRDKKHLARIRMQPAHDSASKVTRSKERLDCASSLEIKESSSRMLFQLPRKCIPIPYSNLGGRLAKYDLTYYSSSDTDRDCRSYDRSHTGKKKRTGGGGYEESSWTTTYMFHK